MKLLPSPRHCAAALVVSALAAGGSWAAAGTPAAAATCSISSGARTAAVVELYTSEGCSSCPPADRQLGQLNTLLAADAVAVPLAFHVNFWDGLGWRDPYAQAAFSERQRWLVQANGRKTVYTPHFFVGGTELRAGADGLRQAVQQVNDRAPAADLTLQTGAGPAGTLNLDATARLPRGSAVEPVLYLAVTENGLVSRVTRGENGGATLGHDHVVRAWLGPFAVGAGGRAHWQQPVPVAPSWRVDRLSVAAVLQDRATGQVLQAVQTSACLAG